MEQFDSHEAACNPEEWSNLYQPCPGRRRDLQTAVSAHQHQEVPDQRRCCSCFIKESSEQRGEREACQQGMYIVSQREGVCGYSCRTPHPDAKRSRRGPGRQRGGKCSSARLSAGAGRRWEPSVPALPGALPPGARLDSSLGFALLLAKMPR